MKYASRCLLPFCLIWLFALAALSNPVCAQTTAPITVFPKYIVLGVVYAPPGSASNVSYGNSSLVGSTDAVTYSLTSNETATTSTTVGGGLFGLGASTTTTDTDGWSTTNGGGNTVTVQTTQGNSVATMGPISSSLGVDHDNDVIYILLNPASVDSITFPNGGGALSQIVWNGLQSNGCDLTDPSVTPTFYQQLSGCDSNQFPYPDIVGIPVWCLKNPYSPNQGCAQWIQYTSRSWDQSYRGQQFPTSGQGAAYPESPLNPAGLTLQDFADILEADPFVALNGNAVNVCHPTYGPDLDPNDPETIPASYPLTPAGSEVNYVGRAPGSCGQPVVSKVNQPYTMNRFQPYGTVEYPVPGPNGLPSTYSGQFEYSATNQTTTNTADSHTVGTSTDTTFGFNNSLGISPGGFGFTLASFSASYSYGNGNSTTWQNQSSTQSTQTQNSTANYSITGPQLSDNYTGPATYSVYLDNIYHTYAFYSPLETKPVLGTIAISPGNAPSLTNGTFSALPSSTVVTSTSPSQSAPQEITLTNTSPGYTLTMAGPAVTFSDPGFVLVENNQSYPDGCSNQQLSAYGTSPNGENYYCTAWIQFAPQYSDAPNPVTFQNEICTSATACSPGVQATMVAAGTENVNAYESILVTSPIGVQSTVTNITQGATLLPTGVSQSTLQNTNPLPYVYNFGLISAASASTPFTFTNNYSSPVDITAVSSTDSIFTWSPGSSNGCTLGGQVAAGGNCTINVIFTPATGVPAFQGAIAVTGTVVTGTTPGWNNGAAFQLANAGVLGGQTVVTITPNNLYPSYEYFTGSYCGDYDYSGTCNELSGGPAGSIGVTNNTSSTVTVTASATTGIGFGNSSCTLAANASCTILFGPTYGTAPSCSPGTGGSISQCTASVTGVLTVTGGGSSAQFNVSETVNYVSYNSQPTEVVVAIGIHGKERSRTGGVLARPAIGTLTVGSESPSFNRQVAPPESDLHGAADDPSHYQVTQSGNALIGGQSAGTATIYDRGTVRYTSNGITAIAEWGSTSTPESIAKDLAASINQVAATYWTASASGGVVNLTAVSGSRTTTAAVSRRDSAATMKAPREPASPDGITVIDSAGFSPASFSAEMNK